jgi:hypothetical protein
LACVVVFQFLQRDHDGNHRVTRTARFFPFRETTIL